MIENQDKQLRSIIDWTAFRYRLIKFIYASYMKNVNDSFANLSREPQIKNTVFEPRLAEYVDVNPRDTKGQLYVYSEVSA